MNPDLEHLKKLIEAIDSFYETHPQHPTASEDDAEAANYDKALTESREHLKKRLLEL